MEQSLEREEFTLVARKPNFGLPTACPICLPIYIYLKFARFPFHLDFNSSYPDSDQIPYIESGTYVTYNNENGGVIQRLKEDGIVDLDADFQSLPEWISMDAMVSSWLADAIMYELWLGSDGSSARKIYYSDLPWLIGKVLFMKQVRDVKQRLGITKENVERREEQIYRRAKTVFGALSTWIGDQKFIFDRPTSLDAVLVGHLLLILDALPDSSAIRSTLLEYSNLIKYAEKLKEEYLDTASSSSSDAQFNSQFSSSTRRRNPTNSGSKPKRKPKREKTEEEKAFSRRAKYFLVTQLVAVLLFLSVMGGYDFSEAEVGDDDDAFTYD
ncbi:hypothetical protein K2173_017411 [Erythroxylum novogranatense]|uniref:Metaxin n=1 Tax=Erythroxylum novogranatense TaxID=1862640 RepID=A0AAV8TKD6_9ROSI|nr:hypothetical protein K2173_017411 [Erythroxylum novogranatense]